MSVSFVQIMQCACGIVCVGFCICMIVGDRETKKIAIMVTTLTLMLSFAAISGEQAATSRNEEVNKAETLIKNGGKIYLDGQEVSSDAIILEKYNIEFKDGNVILSEPRGILGIPF